MRDFLAPPFLAPPSVPPHGVPRLSSFHHSEHPPGQASPTSRDGIIITDMIDDEGIGSSPTSPSGLQSGLPSSPMGGGHPTRAPQWRPGRRRSLVTEAKGAADARALEDHDGSESSAGSHTSAAQRPQSQQHHRGRRGP
eukprot:gene38561-33157_t